MPLPAPDGTGLTNMPIYEYRCPNGHEFEVFQSMSEEPVSVCQECGAPVERVFHPVAVHFKGSGFYTTDYARKTKGSTDGAKESSESKSESKPSEKSDKKPAATSSSGKDD
jgi:putative FmdB family regulatory protein